MSLIAPVVLLAAAVIAVPIFKRIGLGSVLGYLIAGLVIGPFGFAFFHDSAAILHVAELGIVMYLFVIGLEMQPSHLWSLRGEIFGIFMEGIFRETFFGRKGFLLSPSFDIRSHPYSWISCHLA